MQKDGNLPGKTSTKQHHLVFAIAILFVGCLAITLIYFKPLNYPPIRSDGVGYYLYLPAAFIYKDIGLQSVLPEYSQYHLGVAIWKGTQNYLIQYPMGLALLLSPFFFLAWILSPLIGQPANGFSLLFQIGAAFSGLFYTSAGMAVLWKVLEKRFQTRTIVIVLVSVLFGTNLFHYATYDSVMSHAYSFFLCSSFLYCVMRIYDSPTQFRFLLAGLVGGLIIITRPNNCLWLIFGLLYDVNSFSGLKKRWSFLASHAGKVASSLVLLFAVLSLQMIYWKAITGSFVVYSYGGATFNFLDPQILNVLISVRKGLLFWSPVMIFIFPGMYYVKKLAPEWFLPALIFLPLNFYVIASWACCWSYGGSFGQRPFVDSLAMFAISLCALYEGIRTSHWRWLFLFLIYCGTVFSIWTMIHYWFRYIPFDETTLEHFRAALAIDDFILFFLLIFHGLVITFWWSRVDERSSHDNGPETIHQTTHTT